MSKIDTTTAINVEKLQVSADLLRALAHPLRLQIMQYIDQEKEANVFSIYKALNIEQSVTSQHLKILKDAKVVFAHKDGKYMRYRLNYKKIDHAILKIRSLIINNEE